MRVRPIASVAVMLGLVATVALGAGRKPPPLPDMPPEDIAADCIALMENISTNAVAAIAEVRLLLPAVNALIAEGKTDEARQLILLSIRRIRRIASGNSNGINIVARRCVRLLHRLKADRALVQEVLAARKTALADIEAAQKAGIQAFFDVFTELSVDGGQ